MSDSVYPVRFDKCEQATVVCALIHYAIAAYDPSEAVRCLNSVAPDVAQPWVEIIAEARASRDLAISNAGDEVSA